MKIASIAFAALLATLLCFDTLTAQRPDRPGGDRPPRDGQEDGPRGRRPGGPEGHRPGGHRPPPPPLMVALDTDRDGVISAKEIANAATALKTLDKNEDGKLTHDELRPERPGRPPEGRGGRPGGDRGQRPDRPDGRRGGPPRGEGGDRPQRPAIEE